MTAESNIFRKVIRPDRSYVSSRGRYCYALTTSREQGSEPTHAKPSRASTILSR